MSCWGDNGGWQIGNGVAADKVLAPWEIQSLEDVHAIATGGDFTCALKNDHNVWCWGYNKLGALGDGTYENSSTPRKVAWEAPAP